MLSYAKFQLSFAHCSQKFSSIGTRCTCRCSCSVCFQDLQIFSSVNGTKRSSLPDIPLTPREQKILEETKALSPSESKATPQFAVSKSAEDLLDASNDYPTDEPPPKPPLPPGYPSPLIKQTYVFVSIVLFRLLFDRNWTNISQLEVGVLCSRTVFFFAKNCSRLSE